MLIFRFVATMLLVGAMILGVGVVSGQDYPNKLVRIFTSPAGGGTDFAARIIAQGLSAALKQPVTVENRVGIIAIETVAKAPPDGYTLLVSGDTLWIIPLSQNMSYDTVRDFSPVTFTGRSPLVLVVHPSVPANSVKELIALAKAKPGELNYASSSVGGTTHLASELFKSMAGVNIVHIPYKGAGPAITALVSGEGQGLFVTPPPGAPHIKSGRLKALAVTSLQPYELFPELPTVSASGLPGYEVLSLDAVFVPAKTPVAIINRLRQEIVRDINRPEVKQKFFDSGLEIVGSSPEESAKYIKSDIAKWSKVIKEAGIRAEQ